MKIMPNYMTLNCKKPCFKGSCSDYFELENKLQIQKNSEESKKEYVNPDQLEFDFDFEEKNPNQDVFISEKSQKKENN